MTQYAVSKDPSPEQKLLAGNLRRYREEADMSQQLLADRAGMDRVYVSMLERGVGNPSLAKIAGLATALGISPADLLRFPDTDSKCTTKESESSVNYEALVQDIVKSLWKRGVLD